MDLSGFLQTTSIEWWNVVLAIVAVVVGWILSRLTRRGTRSVLARVRGVSDSLAEVVSRIAGYLVLLLGIGIALALLGANIQPLLAIVLVVALVAALVLRGVADNFAAGVLIQTRRPIEIGDVITFEGPDGTASGTVHELNSRAVVVLTHDGRTAHVPNSELLKSVIMDESTHGALRSEVRVRIERGERAVDELTARLVDAAGRVEGVHSREPVRVLVVATTAERMSARLQFWHGPRAAPAIVSDVVRAVGAALEADGIVATVTSEHPDAPLTPPDAV